MIVFKKQPNATNNNRLQHLIHQNMQINYNGAKWSGDDIGVESTQQMNYKTETIENLVARAATKAIEKFCEEGLPGILGPVLQKNLATKAFQKDELMSRAQVSKELQCSLSHTDKLIRSGILPAYRIASNIRIKRSEFEASLQRIKTFKHARLGDMQGSH